MSNTPEAVEVLSHCDLFRYFTKLEIEDVVRHAKLEDYSPEQEICLWGEPGTEFFVIVSGRVEFTVPGRSEPVRSEGPGLTGFFGEVACMKMEGKRTATVKAVEPTCLLVIPRQEFIELLQSRQSMGLAVIRHLAERLKFHTDGIVRRVLPPLEENQPSPAMGFGRWWLKTLAAVWNPSARRWLAQEQWAKFTNFAERGSAQIGFTLGNLLLWALWLGAVWYFFKYPPTSNPGLYDTILNALTLWVSLQAILMTTFVLVAQRRAKEMDELKGKEQHLWASQNLLATGDVLDQLKKLEHEVKNQRTGPNSTG